MSPRDGQSCKVASLHMARYVALSRAAVSRTFAPDASVLSNTLGVPPALPGGSRSLSFLGVCPGYRNTGKTPGTAAFFFWCGAVEHDSSYV
jgi:hypothetical protein